MGPIICLTVIVLGLISVSTFVSREKVNVSDIVGSYLWAMILCAILGLVAVLCEHDGTYKQGQTDALNGVFKYERQFVIPEGDSIVVDTLYIEID